MNFTFLGDTQTVTATLDILKQRLSLHVVENGYQIILVQDDQLSLDMDSTQTIIHFKNKSEFCRMFALFYFSYQKQKFIHRTEKKQFKHLGTMFDCSRNAVPTVETIKDYLLQLAFLGYDTFMLYTEDTYEVTGENYFGHFRGAYSQKELKEIDDFADALGIEVIPCIQTLAHLTNMLKWYPYHELRDTPDILLVDYPATYQFLDKMIQSATSPFRSNRIHIGMDEAHHLGLGRYLQQNGYENRFEIMQKHLQQLMVILKEYQLEPMMWSDMFFRMGSQTGDYYDLKAEIPEEIIAQIPDIDMVYWDYYHVQEQEYDILLQKHQNLQQKIIFAGGIWTFNGIAPNYGQTFRSSTSALNACKKQNIEEIFVTVWLDDGAETPLATIFPGLLLYAEHTYQDIVTEKELQERFDLYYDMKLDDWLLLTQFDETPGVIKDNLTSSAPSKFLLWQDILLGLYDQNIAPYDIKKYYQQLEKRLKKVMIAPVYQPLFEFYQQLAHVLTIKATMGIELTNIYQQQDKILAKQKINELEELILQIKKLHHLHYQIWFQQNKPFGWEVIDIRYGGLLMRIQTSISRLNHWIQNDLPLEELEVQRLTTLSDQQLKQGNLGRQLYQHIVSASKLSDV